MARSVHSDVLDGALNIIKNNATQESICSQEPTTRTEAVTTGTYSLGNIAVTGTDFTVAAGDGGGDSRKVTVAQKQESSGVDSTGTADHVALTDATRLLFVTTCTSQGVTSGNDLTINSWKIEIGGPTA